MKLTKIRAAIISVVLLNFFLFSIASVSAHDEASDERDHMTHYELRLEPGADKTFKVTWDGQPLKARWIFLISAKMSGDALTKVSLSGPDSETPFISWDWTVDGNTHTHVAELPQDGFYDLSFINSSESLEAVDISFQFDQSCECVGKNLDLKGGVIVFQQKVEENDRIRFDFGELPGTDFFVWAGARNHGPLIWKGGFDLVAEASNAQGKISIDYITDRSGTHYFFIESISGTGFIVPEYTVNGALGSSDRGMPDRAFLLPTALSILLCVILVAPFILNKRKRGKDADKLSEAI